MIPKLLNGISHRFSKRVNKLLCICTIFLESCQRNEPRAFAWAARNDRNRAGRATENRMLQIRTTVSLAESQPARVQKHECERGMFLRLRHDILAL